MEELRLGVIESQFAEIIWSNEPLPSGEPDDERGIRRCPE